MALIRHIRNKFVIGIDPEVPPFFTGSVTEDWGHGHYFTDYYIEGRMIYPDDQDGSGRKIFHRDLLERYKGTQHEAEVLAEITNGSDEL